jgi:hypothetical protein
MLPHAAAATMRSDGTRIGDPIFPIANCALVYLTVTHGWL